MPEIHFETQLIMKMTKKNLDEHSEFGFFGEFIYSNIKADLVAHQRYFDSSGSKSSNNQAF